MTSARTTVSYRRNRDYSKSFKWTYELDKDLFTYYEQAKLNPRNRYMNSLKTNWHEMLKILETILAVLLNEGLSWKLIIIRRLNL